MQLLYEENGELKVGSVLAQAPASFQVESLHGRRSKVKAGNVLLTFERPSGAELLQGAQRFAEELDVQFLWECSGPGEFGFRDLAEEYVGRDPSPVEAAGVLLKLHSSPMYFYRRGKGRFQAAPEETLQRALAGVEKRKRMEEAIADWTERLSQFDCPPEIAALRNELLYAPDRNKPETKAFEAACRRTGLTGARLFERCGLLPDAHEFHLQRFLHEFFPHGTGFPPHEVPPIPQDLPLAEAPAFSLDDVGTSEIDDAFSVQRRPDGTLRVGIHIAAPALGFGPGSALDAIARERLSTAYMPGIKITMLPEDVIARFSLDHGGERAAVSLYFDFDEAGGTVRNVQSRLERVPVVANLHHARYDVLNEAFEEGREVGLAHETELRLLYGIALVLETQRGRPSAGNAFFDYNFHVEGGRVRIERRKRGAPLDKLVSELMILANTSWGTLLAERDVAAIYRVQSTGKVRLSIHPEAHEGLGVEGYAWFTSPLRRYVDLLNQWQLAAVLGGRRPPYARNSDAFLAALRAFEVTYTRYDEHQRGMEMYWTLRWIEQEGIKSFDAVVLRENLVRAELMPLVIRVPSLPNLDPGTRVRLEVGSIDYLERTLHALYRGKADGPAALTEEGSGGKA